MSSSSLLLAEDVRERGNKRQAAAVNLFVRDFSRPFDAFAAQYGTDETPAIPALGDRRQTTRVLQAILFYPTSERARRTKPFGVSDLFFGSRDLYDVYFSDLDGDDVDPNKLEPGQTAEEALALAIDAYFEQDLGLVQSKNPWRIPRLKKLPRGEKYPVVLIPATGSSGLEQFTSLGKTLAEAGYVVLAFNYTGSTRVTAPGLDRLTAKRNSEASFLEDGTYPRSWVINTTLAPGFAPPPLDLEANAEVFVRWADAQLIRANDMVSALRQLAKINLGFTLDYRFWRSGFFNQLDLNSVSALGYSAGTTAIDVAKEFPVFQERLQAIVHMAPNHQFDMRPAVPVEDTVDRALDDPVLPGGQNPGVPSSTLPPEVPTLWLLGEEDETISFIEDRLLIQLIPGVPWATDNRWPLVQALFEQMDEPALILDYQFGVHSTWSDVEEAAFPIFPTTDISTYLGDPATIDIDPEFGIKLRNEAIRAFLDSTIKGEDGELQSILDGKFEPEGVSVRTRNLP